jgi:hypothetical protein
MLNCTKYSRGKNHENDAIANILIFNRANNQNRGNPITQNLESVFVPQTYIRSFRQKNPEKLTFEDNLLL